MSVQSLLPGGMSKAVISIGNVFPDPVGKQLRTWLFSSESSSPITSAYSVDKCVNFEKGV